MAEDYNKHPAAESPASQPTSPGGGVQKKPEPTVPAQKPTPASANAEQYGTSERGAGQDVESN